MKKASAIGDILAESSRWRNHNPIRNLNPSTMITWLEQWRAGYLFNLAEAWDEIIGRDDLIPGVVAKRKKDVGRCKYEIVHPNNVDEDSKEAKAHAAALSELYDNLTVTDATDFNIQGGMAMAIRQMMDVVGYKYHVHEIVWQPGSVFTAELRRVPLRHFNNTEGRLRYAPNGSYDGMPLAPGEWLIAATDLDPLMKATGIAYLYKIMPLRDWLTYSESNGLLYILFKTTAAVNSAEWQAAEDMVAKLAGIFGAVVSDGTEMERLGAGSGELPYPGLIERMDKMITALWRGSNLSTISGDEKGASVQADEQRLNLEDDCGFIAETFNIGLSRPYLQLRFGAGTRPLAYLKITPPTDIDETLEQKKFSQAMDDGVPVSKSQYTQTLSLREPRDEEDTLRRKAPVEGDALSSPNADPTNGDDAEEEEGANERVDSAVQALLSAQGEDFADFHRILDALEETGDSALIMDFMQQLQRALDERGPELIQSSAVANELHRVGVEATVLGAALTARKLPNPKS